MCIKFASFRAHILIESAPIHSLLVLQCTALHYFSDIRSNKPKLLILQYKPVSMLTGSCLYLFSPRYQLKEIEKSVYIILRPTIFKQTMFCSDDSMSI